MSVFTGPTAESTSVVLRPGAHPDRAADVLKGLGVLPGHRVALHAANSPAFVLALLGLMRLGAGVVLVDHQRSFASAQQAAGRAGADWLLRDRWPAREEAGPVPVLALTELTEGLPSEEASDASSRDDTLGTPSREGTLDTWFDAWARRDDALIAWSSGSTGEPKAIVRSGRSVLDNTERTIARMGYRQHDVLAPLLPFSHQYGFSLVLLAQAIGCGLLLVTHTRLDRALRAIGEQRASVVDAAPSSFRSLLRLVERRPVLREELRTVRMWCTGGAPLDDRLAEDFRVAVGLPLLDGYGSTELGNVALTGPGAPDRCVPLPGLEVSVRDAAGRRLPAGRPGEVWVCTPDVMRGLLKPDGVTVDPPEPGDFRTHDLGVLDAGGSLRVLGRMSATTRHGYTLYPADLARRAARRGRAVHVVPVQAGRRGTRLVFLVEDPEQRTPTEWFTEFEKALEPYELPNLVLVLDNFPLNNNGKTDVRALEERARRALAKGEQT